MRTSRPLVFAGAVGASMISGVLPAQERDDDYYTGPPMVCAPSTVYGSYLCEEMAHVGGVVPDDGYLWHDEPATLGRFQPEGHNGDFVVFLCNELSPVEGLFGELQVRFKTGAVVV